MNDNNNLLMKEFQNNTDMADKEPQTLPSMPMKTCPFCGEQILAIAKKCKYCGEWLEAEPNINDDKQEHKHTQDASEINRNYSKFRIAATVGASLYAINIKTSFFGGRNLHDVIGSMAGIDGGLVSTIFDVMDSLVMIFMWYGLGKYLSALKINKNPFNTLIVLECAIIPLLLVSYLMENDDIDVGIGMIFYMLFIAMAIYYPYIIYKAGKIFENVHEKKLGRVLQYYSIASVCIVCLMLIGLVINGETLLQVLESATSLLGFCLYYCLYRFFKAKADPITQEDKQ